MIFRFLHVCGSNGRHEYECVTCGNRFWFAPGRELDEDLQPRWSGCPHCAGWRRLDTEEDV